MTDKLCKFKNCDNYAWGYDSYCYYHKKIRKYCKHRFYIKILENGMKWICFLCQKKVEEIHHRNGNAKDNRRENLLPLCHKCHGKIHSAIVKIVNKKNGIKYKRSYLFKKITNEFISRRCQ